MQNSTSTNNSKPPPNASSLYGAGKLVENIIKSEETYLDLADVLTGATSDSYVKPLLQSNEDFIKINSVPVPQVILSEMEGIQCRSFMGLLPEIGRAWMTIDHRLFLWSYTNPRDWLEYSEQDQIISGAGIVKPKPEIFDEKISHLFVFSTPLQVILLGLSLVNNELKVYLTDICVPADDVQMRSITGTDDGRIFMVGDDTNVYELVYYHPNNMFSSSSLQCRTSSSYMRYVPGFRKNPPAKIKDIAVDNERKVLYMLGDTFIEAVYLGEKSDEFKSIAKNTTIVDTAIQMCRQHSRIYNSDAFILESLHIISEAESKRIHLMAMTSAGFRLYFSLYKDGFRNTMMDLTSSRKTPDALEFGHIRIPPIQELSQYTNSLVRGTYYDCGICLSIKTKNDEVDTVVVTAAVHSSVSTPDQLSYSYFTQIAPRPVYLESVDVVDTLSKAYMLSETQPDLRGKRCIKELPQQFSQPPRQFMVLTTRGIEFYDKLRPIDVLHKLIIKQGRSLADERKEFQTFFERYGIAQSCAMCLSIICSLDSQEEAGINSQEVIAKATSIFFEYGGLPIPVNSFQMPGNHLGLLAGPSGVDFSGKHDGFLLYFGRLVAPIWNLKVFNNCNVHDHKTSILFAKTQHLLYEARCSLESLKQFMNRNPKFHNSASIADPRFQASDSNSNKLELDLAEQRSIHELYMLLLQCNDIVYFIEFLLFSNIHDILSTSGMTEGQMHNFLDLDMDTMITTVSGKSAARDLVIITIAKYGSTTSHTNFDIVSNQLQKQCNSYFKENDILFFKGMEYLRRVINTEIEYEQRVYITESLDYFKKSAETIGVSTMSAICSVYVNYAFHVGVVELALVRAKRLDPRNIALLELETPKESEEKEKKSMLQLREESYDFAIRALEDAYQLRSHHIPMQRSPIKDANVYYRLVIDKALESKDKLFHYRLYEWFMNNNLRDELKEINTPYIISYFQEHVGDEKNSLEFLWDYYRNRDKYVEAAKCLYLLATSKTTPIHLNDRIQYLTFARINLNSVAQDQSDYDIAEFYARIECKIQLGSLQSRIQKILKSQPGINDQLEADKLEVQLLDEDDLKKYENILLD